MEKLPAIVTSVKRQSHDTVTIYFTLQDGSTLPFTAGQYITVFFENTSTPQGKAYSLATAPHENPMGITVKKVGEYSGLLHALKKGDMFTISAAYGHFNPHTGKPIVALAGGVGISPIWSVLKHELQQNPSKQARCFYSNKLSNEIPHCDELSAHDADYEHFTVQHHITREDSPPQHMQKGRIDLDHILKDIEHEAHYLVCGSVAFVRDMWRGLTERGVPKEQISTETFFEQ